MSSVRPYRTRYQGLTAKGGYNMQCVTPMFRLYNPFVECDSNAKIVPRKEVLGNLVNYDPNYIKFCLDKMNKELLKKGMHKQYQTIPCGHCWACKLNYSAQWATRNTLEAQEHDNNYFITLTYDDMHLPIYKYFTDGENYFENDGTWNGTLEPEDVHTFINTLRKYFERQGVTGIKYYYCGEYGENTLRPHYHMLLFGAPLDPANWHDFHMDERYKMHWKDSQIEKWWNKGMIDVAEIEWSSAAYVSRYCMKKLTDEPKSETFYAQQGKIKEFIRMSRNPGIGMTYFNLNKEKIYENDEMIMKTVKGNTGAFKPPKAFDKKFKELHPEQWPKIQESRKQAAERSRHLEYELSDYTDLKRMEIKADKLNQIAKELPRILE